MKALTIVFAVFLSACRAERHADAPPAEVVEPSQETFALGSDLTPAGAVAKEATCEAFVRGGSVFLSVNVNGASNDQKIEVEWLDAKNHVMRTETRRVPGGTRYVAFSSGRTAGWSPGPHRVVIVIDGRTVSEKTFAVL